MLTFKKESLVASARRLTSLAIRSRSGSRTSGEGWQADAWEMYDLVGEQRFLATTLSNRMAQAKLFVGLLPDDPTEAPEPVEDESLNAVLAAMGSGPGGLSQILQRIGVNLFVAGDCWLAGIPRNLIPATLLPPETLESDLAMDDAFGDLSDPGTLDIEDLEWYALSVTEVRHMGDEVLIALGPAEDEQIRCTPEDLLLIRVWRSHPRRRWEADSPTRSSLPVLRELVGLTMHISAQVDSRLAGAGLLIIPRSAQRALNIAAGLEPDSDSDQFAEALMEAMLVPIQDRASASALVPLVVTVPDEATQLFEYLNFAKPLDTEARNLRDEAIRRLALGQDAPPELLLGTAGMNHWGAWLVREDVVNTHIEPPLALICEALTSQYLHPVLMDRGMERDEATRYVIWYDVGDMVIRPNRAQDAAALHTAGVISDASLRDASGFSDADAPPTDPPDPVDGLVLDFIAKTPELLADPGIESLREQLRALLTGAAYTAPPAAVLPGMEAVDAQDAQQDAQDAQPDATTIPIPSPTTPPSTPGGVPVPSGTIPATDQAPAPAIGVPV